MPFSRLFEVDGLNPWRWLKLIGEVPPAEFQQAYYDQLEGQARAA